MNKLARLFIKTSLVYLVLSAILGVLITIGPGYSFMHSHFAVVGWVSFMLFGLAYESIPRYTSRAIFSKKLGMIQFWLANIGLIGLSVSYSFMRMYMLKEKDYSDAITALMIFGLIEAISCFIFVYNIWKSMGNTGTSK
ncbi:MAG TPA: cbb3-type cytochrome c oxidase subunit I [Candidatus Methanoperedens sp.]|nr:cbb3-type cytochrome c oxidase subunit I [Candidatus Methanoperedens sp.]